MAKALEARRMPKKDYEARVPLVREELIQLQVALQHAGIRMLVVVGGDEAAGKGEVVNLLNAWLDPRGVQTFAFHAPTEEERQRPPMWRYWRSLPPRGRAAIYFGGWHADALAQEPKSPKELADFNRMLGRLVHFETLLVADDTLIVKVWLRLARAEQKARLTELEKDPDTAWRVTADDWKRHRAYDRSTRLAERMRRATHLPESPWQIIDAADIRARNLSVAQHVLARFKSHQLHRRVAPKAAPRPARVVALRREGLKLLRNIQLEHHLTEEAYAAKRDKWLGRLNRLVRAAAAQQRSIVWVFEGWDAAGKGGAIRRLTSAIDARDYRVIPVAKPTDEEKAHHYLWRFWRDVPGAGRVTIYDRSWYGRVLVERIEGFCRPDEWRRAYDELQNFETQLTDHGIVVVKFWLHLSKEEQLRRFRHREETAYKRHKINEEDWRNRKQWKGYETAVGDMLVLTNQKQAPWHLIPADNKRFARLEILKLSCYQIAAALGEDI